MVVFNRKYLLRCSFRSLGPHASTRLVSMEIGHRGTCEVGIDSTVESLPFLQPLPQSQQQQC